MVAGLFVSKPPSLKHLRNMSRSLNYTRKKRSRTPVCKEYDEERGYRHPPSKLRSSRNASYEYEDDDWEDYKEEISEGARRKRRSSLNLINLIILCIIFLASYFIAFPEDNFLGINLNENEHTKTIFAKIKEWKELAMDKVDEITKFKELEMNWNKIDQYELYGDGIEIDLVIDSDSEPVKLKGNGII